MSQEESIIRSEQILLLNQSLSSYLMYLEYYRSSAGCKMIKFNVAKLKLQKKKKSKTIEWPQRSAFKRQDNYRMWPPRHQLPFADNSRNKDLADGQSGL